MDDLAEAATGIGVQRAIKCVKDFCDGCGLKLNVDKTNIVVFKKKGKLNRNEKGWMEKK
jgi:hypothetical protein